MKTLFVSYRTATSVGNCTIELENEQIVATMQDIKSLQCSIETTQKLEQVIIDNIIMLPIK